MRKQKSQAKNAGKRFLRFTIETKIFKPLSGGRNGVLFPLAEQQHGYKKQNGEHERKGKTDADIVRERTRAQTDERRSRRATDIARHGEHAEHGGAAARDLFGSKA